MPDPETPGPFRRLLPVYIVLGGLAVLMVCLARNLVMAGGIFMVAVVITAFVLVSAAVERRG